MIPLLPLAAALGGLAWWRARAKKGMTPERQKVYEAALASLKDPDALRKLADAFQKEGLAPQAELLRKRAALRELPAEVKTQRRDALRKGLQSKNVEGVEKLAAAFAKEGASGAAASLKQYAAGLKASTKKVA